MADNLLSLATQQFSTNYELLLQQQSSIMRPLVSSKGGYVGKGAVIIDQFGTAQFSSPEGEFAPLTRQEVTNARRWVLPNDKELKPIFVDQFDKLRVLIDPMNAYNMAVAAAAARTWDDMLIASVFATAYTGTGAFDSGGLGTEAWSTSYDVADTFGAGGSTGLTVAKFVEARRLMRKAHALSMDNPEPISFAIGSWQEADLINQAQLQSNEFNPGNTIIKEGTLTRVMGANVVVTERLTVSSNIRSCPFWVQSGLHLAIWADQISNVTQRMDLSSQPYQLYAKFTGGAARTQLGKIIKVKCGNDTSGSDSPVS